MMHSSPMPLTVALDMTKRLRHELASRLTPEQKRDFGRIERLLTDAQTTQQAALARAKQAALAAPTPGNGKTKKRFWQS